MKFFIKPKRWIHDIAMVLREENVYSYNNAKMFDQGGLFHSFY